MAAVQHEAFIRAYIEEVFNLMGSINHARQQRSWASEPV